MIGHGLYAALQQEIWVICKQEIFMKFYNKMAATTIIVSKLIQKSIYSNK